MKAMKLALANLVFVLGLLVSVSFAEDPHAYLNEKGGTPGLSSADGYPLHIGTQGNDDIVIFVDDAIVERYDAETSQKLGSLYALLGTTTALEADVTTATTAIPFVAIVGSSGVRSHLALVQNVASAQGAEILAMKTRAAAGQTDADVIVASGDDILKITAYGADGVTYSPAAQILMESGGTPGADDMPGQIRFLVSADGAETLTEALKVGPTGLVTAAAGVTVTTSDVVLAAGDLTVTTGDLNIPAAANLGVVAENGANTACDTTCTQGCIVGFDAGTNAFVACTSALADSCACAGAGS